MTEDRAISLNAVIDALHQSINLFEAEDRIRDLQPVKPQEPKAGHWVDLKEDNEMSDDDMSGRLCFARNVGALWLSHRKVRKHDKI